MPGIMDGKKTALGEIQVFENSTRPGGLLKVLKSYC